MGKRLTITHDLPESIEQFIRLIRTREKDFEATATVVLESTGHSNKILLRALSLHKIRFILANTIQSDSIKIWIYARSKRMRETLNCMKEALADNTASEQPKLARQVALLQTIPKESTFHGCLTCGDSRWKTILLVRSRSAQRKIKCCLIADYLYSLFKVHFRFFRSTYYFQGTAFVFCRLSTNYHVKPFCFLTLDNWSPSLYM